MYELGSKEKPCENIKDLKKIIMNKSNCYIYVSSIQDFPKELWEEIYKRKIRIAVKH